MGENLDTTFDKVDPWPESENHSATVIFVHGLRSDKDSAWAKKNDQNGEPWPNWLANTYNNLAVAKVGYPTSGVNDISSNFEKSKILFNRLNNVENIFSKPIIFVCHSMGGILLKQILILAYIRGINDYKNSVKGIIFFGTPHRGSNIANFLSWFTPGAVLVPQIRDLIANNSYIESLNELYKHYYEKVHDNLNHKSFHELRRYKGVLVVPQNSAELNIGQLSSVPLERNHIDICKFEHPGELGYVATLEFLRDVLKDTDALEGPEDYQEPNAGAPSQQKVPVGIVAHASRILGGVIGSFVGLTLIYFYSGLKFGQLNELVTDHPAEMVWLGILVTLWTAFVVILTNRKQATVTFLYSGAGLIVLWLVINASIG